MQNSRTKYVLSYGGGLNSTALLVYIIENKMPIDLVLFADTGDENHYTYDTVSFYKKYAFEHGIKFEIVKHEPAISLYDYCYSKKITPSRFTRNCTKNFKITPMRKYIKQHYGKDVLVTLYIGIDYSESHRIRNSDVKYITNVYPLIDAKIGRQSCITLLQQYNLPVPQKSGCWYCPFKKRREWDDMLEQKPEIFDKAIRLEQNSKYYPDASALLSHMPLIKIKNRMKDQTKLYDFEQTCDVSGSCFL